MNIHVHAARLQAKGYIGEIVCFALILTYNVVLHP